VGLIFREPILSNLRPESKEGGDSGGVERDGNLGVGRFMGWKEMCRSGLVGLRASLALRV